MSIELGDTWYRYNTTWVQEEGQSEPEVSIYLLTYNVTRITPAMVVLDGWKRVLKDAHKRYAYPTKELALNSLVKRTRWRLMYIERAVFVAQKVNEFLKTDNRLDLLTNDEITIYKGDELL